MSMSVPRVAVRLIALAAGLLILASTIARAGESASPDDIAKFLAGLAPSAGSPLEPLTRRTGWQQHAAQLDAAWKDIEQRQLSRIRTWTAKHLPQRQPAVFYMFSGPDFLYADTFFPHALSYVLSGLEPVGAVPDPTRLSHGAMQRGLAQVQASLATLVSYSFFITEDMKEKLNTGDFTGTLPILYVFLARTGKTIRDVSFIELDKDGIEQPLAGRRPAGNAATGVKITFSDSDGRTRMLTYVSADLSDVAVARNGFLKFCERLGTGDSLIKSASYLMHLSSFSKVRDFLLVYSAAIVQDDSGIPIRHFDRDRWALHAFGSYRGPISVFAQHRQEALAKLFEKGRAAPIEFGIGYRWRPHETNLMLAVRKVESAEYGP